MENRSSPARFHIEVGGEIYQLRRAEFNGVLCDIVTTLVFEKLADRASYVLKTVESELRGSGSSHFDPLCVSLYRHLKEERCHHGPHYPELGGETQSFKIHSIKNALVAVAFFLRAGKTVPHFTVGRAEQDVLVVMDRGAHTRLSLDDPRLVARLTRLIAD